MLQEIEKQLSHPDTYADKNKFQKAEQDYKSKNSLVLGLEKKYEILFNEILELEG